ncbi:MAG: hypothetical protein QOE28_1634 [Solirubrobacteraceae bacterium]|nr:hypothetical protein [Solirubrobacteraceae bacterium]
MLLENNAYPDDVRVRLEAEALTAAGHRVTVLAPREPGQQRSETVDGVEVRRFWLPPDRADARGILAEYLVAHVQLLVRALWRLARGADVVHLHNPPDTLFPAGLAARALGRRMVFDNHDLTPELFEDKFGGARVAAVLRLAQRISMRSADLVVASNQSQAELAAGLRRRGAAGVTVVRNGPRRADLAAAPEWRQGSLHDPVIGYLGQLASQDGVLDLVDLLAALRGRHRLDARLSVIGDGPARPALERALDDAGLAGFVTFHGSVPFESVPGLLAGADVCVDPAPCNELNHRSTMTKIAEYLAAGRPVAAFRLAETERTAGDAALLARCGDRERLATNVQRLCADGEERRRLGERAVARREELVWEHSARSLTEAYAALYR